MIGVSEEDAELPISHASIVTALVKQKQSAIKCCNKGRITHNLNNFIARHQPPEEHNRPSVQIAVISMDSQLFSSISEFLHSKDIDDKDFQLNNILQGLDQIEFKPLDSVLEERKRLAKKHQKEQQRAKLKTEVDVHVENEKSTSKKHHKIKNKATTVINAVVEDGKNYPQYTMDVVKQEASSIEMSLFRSQSLQSFGTKKSSRVLQRSHSWICSAAPKFIEDESENWSDPADIKTSTRQVKKKRRRKKRPHAEVIIRRDTSEDDDYDGLPKRAKWTIMVTAFLLLVMCLSLVGITLRMAPLIDDMVQIENERLMKQSIKDQFYRVINGSENVT